MRKSVPFDCRKAAVWFVMLAFGWMITTSTANAQLPSTRLFAVFPTGGQVGTTVDVTLTNGQELEEIQRLLFNHPGITATPKMQDVAGKQQPVLNQFVVTIAGDVPPANYEVRAVGFFGISNPRTFVVGNRKEINETEPNNTRDQAGVVELNQTVNGRINGATDIDWFKFTGKAGQRILVDCLAKRLDSKLDAKLTLYDANRMLREVRNSLVSKDALLDVTLPADGEYFLKLHDFVYAGGEDYPYRLTITTGPFIDFVMPPAGTPGSNSQYTLYGRNLPGGQPSDVVVHKRPLEKLVVNIPLPNQSDTLDPKAILEPFSAGMDAVPYSIDSPAGRSDPVMIYLSSTTPILEVEPNNTPAQSQRITVPCEVAGQFQSVGDVDCYTFEAKAKDSYWIEVIAHRAGSAADPVVVIDQVKTNDKGEETLTRISALDDDPTNPLPNLFDTINDDLSAKFVAPADGVFRITMRDRYSATRGDASLVYRLVIRPETPDYRVVAIPTAITPPGQRQAAPSGVTLRRGDNVPIHVLALRRDGFAGPITVSAEGLPPGVTCRDISLGTTPSSGIMVFTAAEDTAPWAGTVNLTAKARIDSPAAVEAFTVAQAAGKAAVDALAAADKALAKPTEELTKANEALAVAKTELAAKPDDEGLKKKVADAEAKVTAAAATHKQVTDARAAADQKVKETQAAVQQAEANKNAAAKEVVHAARYGTILWNSPQPNQPPDARVAQALELSVIEEPAPIQLTTEAYRFEVNHNRQILIPVKVARRNGFDQPVNLTFAGQPQNAQVENKAIPKEKTEEVFRVFLPPNTPVGTYVMYLAGPAQVSYRKNAPKADRLKAEFTAAEQAANQAAEALKAATATRDAANKKVADDAANLKKATEAKQAADKALADAQNAEKAAAEGVKTAGDNVDAKAAAEKKLTETQAVVKTAADGQAAAEKARVDSEVTVKQAEEAKVKAEADLKAADDKNKTATNEKAAADQRFKAADTYAKANNIQFTPHTTPIVITVKTAPYTVSAAPADGGNIKQGGKIEVKCEVKRQNGFVGPVSLTLPIPPNVTGVKAEPVTIPPDQSAGVLVIEAAADAPEAQLANMVVRAVTQWEGEAAVDQPVTLKVVK